MSIKNNMLLDKDFARRYGGSNSPVDLTKKYPFRLAANRRNRRAAKPYWDVYWPGAISKAISELGIEAVNINGGTFFKTKEDLDTVSARAEDIWNTYAA